MKALALAIVLAMCGDAAFNQHRVTSSIIGNVASLFHASSDEVGGSVFRS